MDYSSKLMITVFLLVILPLSVLAATCETVLLPERLDVGDVNVDNLPGWNFQDWTTWAGRAPSGTDPHADGTNCFNSVFYVGMLRSAATVAAALDEPELAALYRRRAGRTADAVRRTFWDEARGLPADDVAHTAFSEHCAAMSVLFDVFGRDQTDRIVQGLVAGKDLTPCTVYFSHYLLDAFAKAGRTDVLLKRLDLWRGYVAKNLRTVQEMPDVYSFSRRDFLVGSSALAAAPGCVTSGFDGGDTVRFCAFADIHYAQTGSSTRRMRPSPERFACASTDMSTRTASGSWTASPIWT